MLPNRWKEGALALVIALCAVPADATAGGRPFGGDQYIRSDAIALSVPQASAICRRHPHASRRTLVQGFVVARSSAYLITEGAAFATSEVPADVADGGQVEPYGGIAVMLQGRPRVMKGEQSLPSDVWLTSHPSVYQFLDRLDKPVRRRH